MLAIAVGLLASRLDVPPSSRAGSLPHWISGAHKSGGHHNFLVGAGLLAKAVGQLASRLDVPPSSRAGSLPHWISSAHKSGGHHNFPVGASLLAKAVGLLASRLDVPPSSRASSHTGSRAPTSPAVTTTSLWERACSRKRWVSLHRGWMCRRHREQARSHIDSRSPWN